MEKEIEEKYSDVEKIRDIVRFFRTYGAYPAKIFLGYLYEMFSINDIKDLDKRGVSSGSSCHSYIYEFVTNNSCYITLLSKDSYKRWYIDNIRKLIKNSKNFNLELTDNKMHPLVKEIISKGFVFLDYKGYIDFKIEYEIYRFNRFNNLPM
jgi:hypothetical protein